MKKSILVLALLIIVVFSVSFVKSIEILDREGTTYVGMGKTRFIEDVSDRPSKPMIDVMHVMGKGIAVNPINLNDFTTLSIVVGSIAMPNGSIWIKGIMKSGTNKYWISNIIINDGKLSADILNANKVDLGNLNLDKKDGTSIWYGVASIDGRNWQIYLLESNRGFSKDELAEKARTYCKENPNDANCNSLAGYTCKDNLLECKNKVLIFCREHEDDPRCEALLDRYCDLFPRDVRCTLTPEEPIP